MQVWGLAPLVLSCWLGRLWSLPYLFLSFSLSSSFGWSAVFVDVTSGFFGTSLPYDRVALGSVNAGVVRL
jgi:hypothetical protein